MLGQSGIIRAKVVLFRQRWLYSGKKGCIWATLFYLGKVVVIVQRLLYSGKLVVIGQFSCIRTECFSRKSGCTRAKWLYSAKNCCFRAKVVVLRQSGCKLESDCILAKEVLFGKMVVFGQG